MIVVSDSTPLISLMKAGQLYVLEGLYKEILIPDAVYAELTTNKKYTDEAEMIKASPFIRVVSVKERKAVDVLRRVSGLDLGESEAIVYVDDNKADILLMDEEAGRRVARAMGLHIQGTIGVLLHAFDCNILSAEDIETAIKKLRANKRHISERMYQYAEKYIKSDHGSAD